MKVSILNREEKEKIEEKEFLRGVESFNRLERFIT